jgi:signal transduction histidine kinase
MRLWQHKGSVTLETQKPTLSGQWVYYLIGLLGGLIALFLWYASVRQSSSNLNHIIELQAEHVANDIKIQFELRISALQHMAKHLEESPALSGVNWQNNVMDFVNNDGGFRAIGFVNPELTALNLYPGQSRSDEAYYQQLIQQRGNTLLGIKNDQPWISSLVNGPLGEKTLFMVMPLTQAINHREGYLISMISVDSLFSQQLSHDDYLTTVTMNGQTIYSDGAQKSAGRMNPKISAFTLNGANWVVRVQPTKHLMSVVKTNLPDIALLLGISIIILFLVTSRLAELARQRAKSLDQMNQDLKNEMAERSVAEASKQRLERELLQGQKLQAIGTLAGGIAHDFNNILYAIMGYVEMARDDVIKDSLVYNNLGKVLEASQRGQELIARILAFSRSQHHEFKPIAIRSTLESVLALLKPTIPASVVINFKDNLKDDFVILGDQTRLHQIVVNLINNAVDAMDGEGTVTITLSVIKAQDQLLRQFPDSRYCKIEIRDTGHGMDQTTLGRIFEPFFTTKEVGKGTGLGLATVHTTVKEHQGEILVTSQLDTGTTFTLLLPEYQKGD